MSLKPVYVASSEQEAEIVRNFLEDGGLTAEVSTDDAGGMLPSPQVLKSLGERFGVPVIRERIFGQDYAKTLASWRNNFRAAWPNLMPLGFDDRFRRLWEYYLAYCEAGFLSGNIDVRQVVFAKSG